MFTSAFGNTITSARIGSFFHTNGKELQSSFEKLASGNTISTPSDGIGDYFRSTDYTIRNKEYDSVTRSIDEATAIIDYSEQANRMIWDDLYDMQALAKDYYSDGATADEKSIIVLEFEELKTRITQTQEGAVYDGKNVLADSSSTPLVSINTDPHDIDQRFSVAFGADKIVDVAALDITAGEVVVTDALELEVEHTASYGAQLSGYRYGLGAQRKMSQVMTKGNDDSISTIQDVDEMRELFSVTKRSIQQQAATSMFAQSQMNHSSMLMLIGM